MILARHESAADAPDGVHRVVLLGRLDAGDADGLRSLGDDLPDDVPVRLVLAKLWLGKAADGEVDGGAGLAALAELGARLQTRKLPPGWAGAAPEVAAALADRGAGVELLPMSPADARAGEGWDGVPVGRVG